MLAGLTVTASSQKVYFMYLQAEPVQPFFLKLNGKIHSSSANGYLILSRLADSTYTFTIGFNQPGIREHVFTVKTGQRDRGFLLKDFGEKGWGLFDLQTLAVLYSDHVPVAEQKKSEPEREVSPFTDLLSRATGDPSLRDKPPAPKPEEKAVVIAAPVVIEQPVSTPVKPATAVAPQVMSDTVAAETAKLITEKKVEIPSAKMDEVPVKAEPVAEIKAVKNEPAPPVKDPEIKAQEVPDTLVKTIAIPTTGIDTIKAEQKQAASQEQVKKEEEAPLIKPEIQVEPEIIRSVVTKRSESSTTEGFGLVFMDTWEGGKIDTIRLLIPNPKQVVALVKETPKPEKKFLEIQATAAKAEEKLPVVEEKVKQAEPGKLVVEEKAETKPVLPAEKPAEKPVPAGPCAETATEADFFTLRKSMAAAEGDEEMISLAKKYFKQKCFTAAQLKNLSALFLNDEAKYNFFDAAYKYTTDKAAFATLETELKDPYYINRFKAMIR